MVSMDAIVDSCRTPANFFSAALLLGRLSLGAMEDESSVMTSMRSGELRGERPLTGEVFVLRAPLRFKVGVDAPDRSVSGVVERAERPLGLRLSACSISIGSRLGFDRLWWLLRL